MTYEEMLARLNAHRDEKYAAFHSKLLHNPSVRVLGVRMPVLRALVREWKGEWESALAFPDEYYEVTFLKCNLVGALPFEKFTEHVRDVVPLIDNWATCDGFEAPCITKHRGEFLPFVKEFLEDEREFVRRYALVTLLKHYMSEEYLPLIFEAVRRYGKGDYYVVMGAAWLLAEVLVRFYDAGYAFLQSGEVSRETAHKAISKACDSFRITSEQKTALKALKKRVSFSEKY